MGEFERLLSEGDKYSKGSPESPLARIAMAIASPVRLFARAEAISLSIGSLDHPANFQPVEHGCTDRQLPWLNIDDDLPRDDTDVAAAEPEV